MEASFHFILISMKFLVFFGRKLIFWYIFPGLFFKYQFNLETFRTYIKISNEKYG
jgi:hypothetical protein